MESTENNQIIQKLEPILRQINENLKQLGEAIRPGETSKPTIQQQQADMYIYNLLGKFKYYQQ